MTETVVTYGQGHVAQWLGVGVSAVSNWLTRHWDSIPKPAAVIISPSGDESYGWTAEQRKDWEDWQRKHVRRPAAPVNKPRHYQDREEV